MLVKEDRIEHGSDDIQMKKLEDHVSIIPEDSTGHKISLPSNKLKSVTNSNSEFDLPNYQYCTPSYRLIPENHRRNYAVDPILNNTVELVTSGREDYSSKQTSRNKYEEMLFRCEDERFLMDLLIESINSTVKSVEELLRKIEDNTIEPGSQICIEDHLTARHLNIIENLYYDFGLEMLDILHNNANLALPVLYTRLKKKQDEWSRRRTDFNKAWSKIYAENFHRSLDHRALYFKQQDEKNLSTKALLGDIRKIAVKKHKEDDSLLASAIYNERPLISVMEFEYSDLDILEEIHQVVKSASEEICKTSKQVDKIMKIWTSFLDPVLGVLPLSQGAEDNEDLRPKNQFVRNSVTRLVEMNDSLGAYGSSRVGDVDDRFPSQHASSCGSKLVDKDTDIQINVSISNKTSRVNMQSAHSEQLTDSHTPATRMKQNNGVSTALSGNGHAASTNEIMHVCNNNFLSLKEGGSGVQPVRSAKESSMAEHINLCKCYGGCDNYNSFEIKKDVMVSANGDTEGGYILLLENTSMDVAPKTKDSYGNHQDQVLRGKEEMSCEEEGENEGHSEDHHLECAERSTKDCGNVPGSGEGVLQRKWAGHDDHNGKTDCEHEDETIAFSHYGEGGDQTLLPFSEPSRLMAKPLAEHVSSVFHNKGNIDSRIFYGNDSFYVLFRLHQILYEGMLLAKMNLSSVERKQKSPKDSNTHDSHVRFMETSHCRSAAAADNTKFEVDDRVIVGTQSNALYTFEKLIERFVKQFQAIASDKMANELLQLYKYEQSRTPGTCYDLLYRENALILLHDKNIYRFECSSSPIHISIHQMEYGGKPIPSASMHPNLEPYPYCDFLSVVHDRRQVQGLFLRRNKRKYDGNDSTFKASEEIQVFNALEHKISCETAEVSYVLDTEDYLIHSGKRRRSVRHFFVP